MAKKKYYAVRQGYVPGIYDSWDECKAQVDGYPKAEYKSFANRPSAERYMDGIDVNKSFQVDDSKPYAFVDGSFNTETGVFGYGGFLRYDGNEVIIQGHSSDAEKASMRNVAGEIEGSLAAMRKAKSLGLTSLNIYYDYQGIESWANGSWKAKNPATRDYAKQVEQFKADGLNLSFVKVTGHTGVPGNEKADKLAKQAVGLLPQDRVLPNIDTFEQYTEQELDQMAEVYTGVEEYDSTVW